MQLQDYSDVLPDFSPLESLDPSQARSALTVLLAVVIADHQINQPESDIIVQEIERLPMDKTDGEGPTFVARLAALRAEITGLRQRPSALLDYLEKHAQGVPEEARIAVCRLMAINAIAGGAHPRKQETAYTIASLMGVTDHTMEQLLRATWESREDTMSERAGETNIKPVVTANAWRKRRDLYAHQMPFTQVMTDMSP